MRDLPPAPRPGAQTPDRQTPVNDRELEGSGMGTTAKLPSCPGTPLQPHPLSRSPAGSPVAPPRPHRAATENPFQPLSLRRQLATQVSLDSPLSPASRPQSPWGRFDPYDSPEVCFCVLLLCVFVICTSVTVPAVCMCVLVSVDCECMCLSVTGVCIEY